MEIKEKKYVSLVSWILKHNADLLQKCLAQIPTVQHPIAINTETKTRKHPDVKLRSDSFNLNYVKNENNRKITV